MAETAAFFAAALAALLTVPIAAATKGKYYLAKAVDDIDEEDILIREKTVEDQTIREERTI